MPAVTPGLVASSVGTCRPRMWRHGDAELVTEIEEHKLSDRSDGVMASLHHGSQQAGHASQGSSGSGLEGSDLELSESDEESSEEGEWTATDSEDEGPKPPAEASDLHSVP